MTTALTLSAIQYTALDGGPAANVLEHIRLIEDADSHGARLVIFPGLSLTGYEPGRLADPEYWLGAGDGRLDGLREICRRTGITAVVGAPLRAAAGAPRLATLVLHPNGGLDTGFRAWRHGPFQQFPGAGDQPLLLDLDGWRIAVAGPDAAGPEEGGPAAGRPGQASPARARVRPGAGADVYAVPAFRTGAEDPHGPVHPAAHPAGHPAGHQAAHQAAHPAVHAAAHPAAHPGGLARDSRIFSLLANLGGATGAGPPAGGSGVWGTDGRVIRQAAGTGTEVLTATLQHGDPDRWIPGDAGRE